MDLRVMERKSFGVKQYEQAVQFSQMSEQMEIEEREAHYQKMMTQLEKDEIRLKKRLTGQMNTLLKRIQRDRDEQLAHRKQDSQTLIQRNRNVLLDMLERHRVENKRTSEFLKYALGHRSKEPGRPIVVHK